MDGFRVPISLSLPMRPPTPDGLKPKDLIGLPWRLAFALQDAGWWLRSEVIWSKPNAHPESVRDRPTKAHSPARHPHTLTLRSPQNPHNSFSNHSIISFYSLLAIYLVRLENPAVRVRLRSSNCDLTRWLSARADVMTCHQGETPSIAVVSIR